MNPWIERAINELEINHWSSVLSRSFPMTIAIEDCSSETTMTDRRPDHPVHAQPMEQNSFCNHFKVLFFFVEFKQNYTQEISDYGWTRGWSNCKLRFRAIILFHHRKKEAHQVEKFKYSGYIKNFFKRLIRILRAPRLEIFIPIQDTISVYIWFAIADNWRSIILRVILYQDCSSSALNQICNPYKPMLILLRIAQRMT